MLILGTATISGLLAILVVIGALGAAYGALKAFGTDAISAWETARRVVRHRAPAVAPGSEDGAVGKLASEQPSSDQVHALDAIFERLLHEGAHPSFRIVDKQLDLEGLRLLELIETMPPGLMEPNLAVGPFRLYDDSTLAVTLDGLAYCERGSSSLDLLGLGLGYLAERERPFIPTTAQQWLTVTKAETARDLSLTADQARDLGPLIYLYGHGSWTGMSGPGGDWTVTVAPEYIRRFRGISNGEQFLRARDGESVVHRT